MKKEIVRPDQVIYESVKTFIRLSGAADKKEIINIIEDIKKYPLIRMDNVIDKVSGDMESITEKEGKDKSMDYINKAFTIGKMCLYRPFFPKSNYYYFVPLFVDSTGVEVILHIDLDKMNGYLLFKIVGLDGAAEKQSAGIMPIIINPETEMNETFPNEAVLVPDINQMRIGHRGAYNLSLTMLNYHTKKGEISLDSIVSTVTGTVMIALGDLHTNNYYPFQVGGNKRGEGGEVIYLNKFPCHPSKANQPTGDTKEPHRRRGYWWTMKDERYRNHRNYQKENANYKPATWIGPKEFKHQGKTYKILFQKDDSMI